MGLTLVQCLSLPRLNLLLFSLKNKTALSTLEFSVYAFLTFSTNSFLVNEDLLLGTCFFISFVSLSLNFLLLAFILLPLLLF